jgi:hypothetical protein
MSSTDHDLSTRRHAHEVPTHVAELMRAWARIGSVQDTRSTAGDPGQIWGDVLASAGRPGPAGAPPEDLADYLRNGIRPRSSSTGEGDPLPADLTVSLRTDAAGAQERVGATAMSAIGAAGASQSAESGGAVLRSRAGSSRATRQCRRCVHHIRGSSVL